MFNAGMHEFVWDASGCPSGIYFARLQVREHAATVKMMVVR